MAVTGDIRARSRSGSVDFRVVDKTSGQPIAGAELVIRVNGTDSGSNDHGCGGVCRDRGAHAHAEYPGRARGEARFRPDEELPAVPEDSEDIPASYTLAMGVVKAVGGVVRDEQGRPIEGVEVKPIIWTISNLMPSRDEFIDPKPISTDARGVWRWESMPAGIEPNRVSFQFSHPDYQRVDLPSDRTAEIIRREVVTVLPRGLLISGRVVHVAGRSIPGARILSVLGPLRERRYSRSGRRRGPVPVLARPGRRGDPDGPGARPCARAEEDRRASGPSDRRVPPRERADDSRPGRGSSRRTAGRGERGCRILAQVPDARLADPDRWRRRVRLA